MIDTIRQNAIVSCRDSCKKNETGRVNLLSFCVSESIRASLTADQSFQRSPYLEVVSGALMIRKKNRACEAGRTVSGIFTGVDWIEEIDRCLAKFFDYYEIPAAWAIMNFIASADGKEVSADSWMRMI